VFGYPKAKAEPGGPDIALENWPLPYVTTTLQVEPEPRDKDKEILLYYYRVSEDAEGRQVAAPSPKGLSGCGIWRLSRAPVRPADTP
jgi:hypothetical protein